MPDQASQSGVKPGKPVLQAYPTPNLADRIFVIHKDSRAAAYKVPTPGDTPEKAGIHDPDKKLEGFVFATAKATDQVGYVDWYFINERLNQDDYNYVVEYPWVSEVYPRVIRTYVLLRAGLPAPDPDELDPKNSDLVIVDYKVTRSEDPVIDSLFVGVTKVYERLTAATDFQMQREDAVIPYAMRTAVPLVSVTDFRHGAAQASDVNVVTNEQDWGATSKMISFAKRQITRLVRILPPGGKTLIMSRKWTRDEQVANVTQTWKIGQQEITPSALLDSASVDDAGNNTTILEEALVDEVFGAQEFGIEIPDLVPAEFSDLAPVESYGVTSEGIAQPPELAIGELSRKDQQVTALKHRETVTARDITQLPKTLVDHEIDGISARGSEFGGDFEVRRTLAVGEQTIDQGFGVTKSRVKHIGRGLTLKETSQLGMQPAYIRVTNGGTGYTCAPTVHFADAAETTATAITQLSLVAPPLPPAPVEVTCSYGFNGDTNGVFYYLGKLGRSAWTNPHTSGEITLSNPFTTLESGTLAQIVDRLPSNVYTNNTNVTSFVIDLGPGRTLLISKLSFRARTQFNSSTTTFNIQGSNDGTTWTDMHSFQDVNDNPDKWTTEKAKSVVSSENIPYRYFRLLQPTNHNNNFMIGELELYGKLTHYGKIATGSQPGASITGVTITAPGVYPAPPNVVFDLPTLPGGVRATGTTELDVVGGVSKVNIVNPGKGYVPPPSVVISGGGGSGATARAVLTGDVVTSIVVTNPGSGYTSAPTITLVGDGAGAVAVGHLALTGSVKAVTVTHAGQGYFGVPSIVFSGGGGANASAQPVLQTDEHNGTNVASVKLLEGGSGYSSAPTIEFVGGSILEYGDMWSVATATASLGYELASISVSAGGSGYTPAPGITFSSPSSATAATAIIGKTVASVTVTNGGSGYIEPPAVKFGASSSGGINAGGAAAIAILKKTVSSATVLTSGSGYTSTPTISFSPPGGGATATAVRGFPVASFSVTAPGSGFTSPPTVAITGGGGTGATAHAVFGKGISSVNVTNPGSGYTSAPTVAFTGGGGSGAAATAVLGFPVDSIAVDNGGSLYSSAPTVQISGDGTGAIAVARLALDLASLALVTPGTGFTSNPTVAITGGGGSGATATAVVGYVIDTISVDAGGSGYVTPPVVEITGDGTGATAHAVLTADAVTSIVVDDPGEGYTTAPTIALTGGSGTGATAHSALVTTGVVKTLTLTNPGTGFTSTPTVAITSGGGSGATATATMGVGGHISAIEIQAAGSGYTAAPIITLVGGGGTGAAATATLGTTGIVKRFTMTNGGSGYTSFPTVALTSGGGSGATAGAALGAQSTTIKSIVLDLPGEGYTSAPTVTITGGGGSGATATSTLGTTGTLKSVTITNAGTGYNQAPVMTVSGGGGTGATVRAEMTAGGSVTSIQITSGGAKYINVPAVTFVSPASGGSGAAGTAVLSSTGSVIAVTLTNPGPAYTIPPLITFTGCNGTGAAALYVLAVGWPVLIDTETDPETGIIVSIRKEIVTADTEHPGIGFVDIQALDKWRSIMITSGIDLHSIPPAEFFGGWRDYQFPNQLISIRGVFSTASTHSDSGAEGGYAQSIGGTTTSSSSSSGQALVKIAHGYRGFCEAAILRTYLYGAPAPEGIPCPFLVIPSYGTIACFGGSSSSSETTRPTSIFDVPGQAPAEPLASSSSVSTNISAQDVGPVLTGGATIDSAGGSMVVDLPPSTPLSFTPGFKFISEVNVTKWRFNMWVIDVVTLTVPPCAATLITGGGST